LNARILLEICEEYNIDIKFVLAQGHIESHFGTKGMALKTNSVFNVLAYDGKSYDQICKKGKYSHPDHSIRPYLELLANDYMVEGKSEYDLLDEFVNKNGDRYASAPDYESKLNNTFINIGDSTNIDELYKQYRKYQMLSGL
jgi:flagellum-specific peptidoglycan hydrolase FlgJ